MAASTTPPASARRAVYKSPKHAQVWFLTRSRDNWKRKHHTLKAQAKRLHNRAADLAKSRDKWRARAQQAEALLQKARCHDDAPTPQPQGPNAKAAKKGAR